MKPLPNNLQDLFVDADFAACEYEKQNEVKFTDAEYFEFIKSYIQKVVKDRL